MRGTALESLRPRYTAAEADARQAWTDAQRQLEQLDAQIAQVHDRWPIAAASWKAYANGLLFWRNSSNCKKGFIAGTRELLKRANDQEAS